MFTGGCIAGEMRRVYGAVPFFGVNRKSEPISPGRQHGPDMEQEPSGPKKRLTASGPGAFGDDSVFAKHIHLQSPLGRGVPRPLDVGTAGRLVGGVGVGIVGRGIDVVQVLDDQLALTQCASVG